MLGGIVNGLIAAWILVQFNADDICINVLQPFIDKCTLTTNHFYFVFGLIGLVSGILYEFK